MVLFLIEQAALASLIEVGGDKGVAALDVVHKVGKRTLAEELQLGFEAVLALVFEHPEEKAELRDLDL